MSSLRCARNTLMSFGLWVLFISTICLLCFSKYMTVAALLPISYKVNFNSSGFESVSRTMVCSLMRNSAESGESKKGSHSKRQTKVTSQINVPNNLINSRYVAVTAAMKIGTKSTKNAPASSILEANPQFLSLTERRDRSFARMLLATLERRLGQTDKILDDCIETERRNKYSQLLKAALRIGVVQLVFLGTPPHAAISETVEVVRTYGKITGKPVPNQLINFINGVLRNVSRNVETYQKISSPMDNLSPWFRQRIIADWGEDKAKKIANQYMKTPHYLDLTFKTNPPNLEGFDDKEIAYNVMENGSVRVHDFNGLVKDIPGYDAGEWWVQSLSASTPALGLISSLKPSHQGTNSLHVGDMCAAPGGKTSQLLSAGFKVTAIESSMKRIKRLNENLDRLNLSTNCNIENLLGQEWEPASPIDGILLDAPCSATGTGIRRPDILQKQSDDIEGLLITQKALCEHCVDNVLKKGGILVYSTCSILREESEDQMKALIARESQTKLRTIPFMKGEIPGFDSAIDENGWLRVLPGCQEGYIQDCDGFFVARLEKL